MKRLISYIVLPFVLIGIFLIAHSREVQALEITAELTPQTLQMESYGQLQITVTGARKADIQVPEIDGLTLQNRGSMQSMQIVNGDTSISYTANYIILPQREGTFTIEPITATVKGETVSAAPIQFEVTGAGSSANRNNTLTTEENQSENSPSFLQFIPQKTRLYVGEKIPFQLKAYFSQDASELMLPIINGDSFIVAPFSKKPQQKQELYKGKMYTVLTWENHLSGVKSGSFPLQFSLDGTLLLPRPQQARDPFGNMDPFGSDIFNNFFSQSRYQQVPVTLKSESTDITVVPLPADQQPKDFSGAVGQFSLSSLAAPLKVSPGEPVTLKLVVTGNGNFDRVQCPDFPDTVNFKVYQVDESKNSNQRGKIFERAIVPKNSNANIIPAHSLTYFDPEQEQYVTVSSKPIALALAAVDNEDDSSLNTVPSPASSPDLQSKETMSSTKPLLLDNLVPQKLVSGHFSRSIQPVHKQLWFTAIVVLLLVCLVLFLIVAARQKAASLHPERLFEKNDQQKRQQHLQAIQEAEQSADQSLIVQSCREALQYLTGKLSGLSPSAVTAASLTHQDNVGQQLIDLLQIAEDYFYGGFLNSYPNAHEYAAVVKTELEKKA